MTFANRWFTYACAIPLFLLAQSAAAASFDCAEATTAIEVGICGDETLSAADEEMAKRYRELLPHRPSLQEEQAAWLRDVRNACDDAECLSKVYLERISALDEQLSVEASPTFGEGAMAPSSADADGDGVCESSQPPWRRLLCLDPTLTAANAELEGQLRKVGELHPDVYSAQARWERDVRNACADTECLSSAYLQRIAELETYEYPAQSEAADGNDESVMLQSNAVERYVGQVDDRAVLGFWLFLGFIGLILILGSTREVVICYDVPDFLWTLAPIAFPIIGMAILRSITPPGTAPLINPEQRLVAILTVAAFTHAIIKIFYNACFYNRSIPAGLFIGCFKVFLGLITIPIVLAALGGGAANANKHRLQHRSAIAIALGLLLFAWLFRAVFNGPAVYEKKGWRLQPA